MVLPMSEPAMMLPNCVEQFAVYLACLRLGVVVTPVPVQYREHELSHILEATGAVAVIKLWALGHDRGGGGRPWGNTANARIKLLVWLAVAGEGRW